MAASEANAIQSSQRFTTNDAHAGHQGDGILAQCMNEVHQGYTQAFFNSKAVSFGAEKPPEPKEIAFNQEPNIYASVHDRQAA